jgi:flavin reductase (DIM6/NTAB) family NADH-FMN oxidoreductase RutF
MKRLPRLAAKPEIAYRLFYPHVPAILCVKAGQVSAMPVASAVPVSHNPSMVATAIRKGLTTHRLMRRSSIFSLNWVDFRKRKIVTTLSTPRRIKTRDKLEACNIAYHIVLGTPVLDDACAYLIIKKERMIAVGDHDLFIGRVVGAMASLDFDEYWKFKEYRPILYLGSRRRKNYTTI